MATLMEVTWTRSGQRAGGSEPFRFWAAAGIDDRLEFARTWPDSPRDHFAKFQSCTTQEVLQIIKDIAEHRTTLLDAITNGSLRTLTVTNPGLWNDTLDVVRFDPRHCGGWLGLLIIRNVAGQSAAVVDRPDPTGPRYFVLWPPITSRRFLDILAWLMQSIRIVPENLALGNSWAPNENMLRFLNGQRATGGGGGAPGIESFAETLRALVYENADEQLFKFYLRHLRGHGPTEAGRVHHLNQMLSSSEVDAGRVGTSLRTALAYQLRGFPAAWSRTRTGDWAGVVTDLVGEWEVGIGNHREGLTWLQRNVADRLREWTDSGIVAQIGGTRETQRTVGTTVSTAITSTYTTVQSVQTSISLAYRQQDSTTWQTTLERAITSLNSLTTRTGGGTSNTTGGSFGNETTVTAGGETGAIEEFLLGKLNGEVSDTVKTQLQTQFTTHLEHERSSTESTSNTSRYQSQTTLQSMRERSYQMTNQATESVSRTLQLNQTLTRSTQSVIDADGDRRQQASLVANGLRDSQPGIDAALAGVR